MARVAEGVWFLHSGDHHTPEGNTDITGGRDNFTLIFGNMCEKEVHGY